jgi:hypothetical protein
MGLRSWPPRRRGRRERPGRLGLCCALLVTQALVPARAQAVALPQQDDAPGEPVGDETVEVVDWVHPSFESVAVTRDDSDFYGMVLDGRTATVTAPETNVGGNTRLYFWPGNAPASVNQVSCVTLEDPQEDFRQPGVILRATVEGDRIRALMVSKNIWEHVHWTFNVHLVDSAEEALLSRVMSVDLAEGLVIGERMAEPPWRLCALAVGHVLAVKVWPLSEPEPAWTDPRFAGSTLLPDDWVTSGHAGWYVGHLRPGQTATVSDLWQVFFDSPYFIPMGVVADRLIKMRHISGITVDIFVNILDDGVRWHGGQFVFWRDKAFSLRQMTVVGQQFHIPADPETYLANHYGDGWDLPDPHFDVFWEAADAFNPIIEHRYGNTLAKAMQFLAARSPEVIAIRRDRAKQGGAEDVADAYHYVLDLYDRFRVF